MLAHFHEAHVLRELVIQVACLINSTIPSKAAAVCVGELAEGEQVCVSFHRPRNHIVAAYTDGLNAPRP